MGLLEIISTVVNPRDLQHNNVCTYTVSEVHSGQGYRRDIQTLDVFFESISVEMTGDNQQ